MLPVRIFSAREFRAELVLAPVRRKFLAAPGLSKRQKDARGMRFLEASGHNPLSGAIATFALAVAVGGASISYTGAEACDPAELTNPFCLRPVRLAGWDVLSPGLGVVADLRAGWLPALVAVLVAGAMRTGIDRLVRRLDPPVADAWPAAKIFGLVAVLTILVLVASSASTLYLVAVIGYYGVCLPATARFVQRAPAVRPDALRRVKDLVEPSTR